MSEIKFLVNYLDKDGNQEIDAMELTTALHISRTDERTDAQLQDEITMHREQGVSILFRLVSVCIAFLWSMRVLKIVSATNHSPICTRPRPWKACSRRNVQNVSKRTTSVRK